MRKGSEGKKKWEGWREEGKEREGKGEGKRCEALQKPPKTAIFATFLSLGATVPNSFPI